MKAALKRELSVIGDLMCLEAEPEWRHRMQSAMTDCMMMLEELGESRCERRDALLYLRHMDCALGGLSGDCPCKSWDTGALRGAIAAYDRSQTCQLVLLGSSILENLAELDIPMAMTGIHASIVALENIN